MRVEGRCFCGAVAWEAAIDEQHVGLCHCRDCQILGGGGFRTVGITAPDSFRFTAGEPERFTKVGDSGGLRVMRFCGRCGTHLCSQPDAGEQNGFVSIRLSTSDQFVSLRPALEIYCDSRVPWLRPVEGAAQFPKMPE